jgi:hypothetical protein
MLVLVQVSSRKTRQLRLGLMVLAMPTTLSLCPGAFALSHGVFFSSSGPAVPTSATAC